MRIFVKIFLVIFICISVLNANEQYSKENITKHLEMLFTKNIRYEKNNKYQRYIPFRDTVKFYYEFSPSIKKQKEKVEILNEVAKKFENTINLKIELKQGKPDITLLEQNGKLNTRYNTKDSLFEEHIYFDFATRDEIFSKLKQGFWNKKFFLGKKPVFYQRVISYINRERSFPWKKKYSIYKI